MKHDWVCVADMERRKVFWCRKTGWLKIRVQRIVRRNGVSLGVWKGRIHRLETA